MLKALFAATALCAVCHAATAADLTALETRWLGAAFPVLQYARSLALPIDIIVQQQILDLEPAMRAERPCRDAEDPVRHQTALPQEPAEEEGPVQAGPLSRNPREPAREKGDLPMQR